MIEILKKSRKKTIDIYELAYEYRKKPFYEWSREEVREYIQQLQELNDNNIIQITRSKKGEVNLDTIHRRITINNWNFAGQSENMSFDLIRFDLGMDASYYLKNTDEYRKDLKHIERLRDYLKNKSDELTLNEIAYEIFRDEKALSQPVKSSVDGKKILSKLGLDIACLSGADTISPFYFPTSSTGDAVLVIENKDTCFTLLRLLSKRQTNIKGIIFGEGRAVVKIFSFLHIYGLEHVGTFFYYGDVDQEGFDIARSLIERYPEYNIKLSKILYHHLLKDEGRSLNFKRQIDKTKSEGILLSLFDEDKSVVMSILENDGCIPQEALNYDDMKVIMDELQYRLF
ncbi:MAG: hypothetical protein CVV02_02155 [Firmicutes bacterium HGW-Firmicutes-7]|nr:MAG: hypothetical protein CVV02_02155 [Firmicutes bacterium HGW-Firmicutes-7]